MSSLTKLTLDLELGQTILVGKNKEKKHPLRRPLGVVSSLLRNMKALKRITLLITVLILCWFSYIIIVILNYHCLCHPREPTWILC